MSIGHAILVVSLVLLIAAVVWLVLLVRRLPDVTRED
jgi:uncharacterized membrane protein YhaH (DUF805 family)